MTVRKCIYGNNKPSNLEKKGYHDIFGRYSEVETMNLHWKPFAITSHQRKISTFAQFQQTSSRTKLNKPNTLKLFKNCRGGGKTQLKKFPKTFPWLFTNSMAWQSSQRNAFATDF